MSNTSAESLPPSIRADLAVVLLNLGTPGAPTAASVRRYLAQFLSDKRVIDYPRWLWLPLLYGVILRVRPRRSARAYASIWTAAGSPLLVNTHTLAQRLAEKLAADGVRVEFAMTYGDPSIPATLDRLLADGVRRMLLLPLYPQYSATSTAPALDGVFAALREQRWLPELRTINDYHDAPEYIHALAASVERYWDTRGRGERLLLSFHGIPLRYVQSGDPYRDQCLATARALRERLGMDETTFMVSFQSRVGRERWLDPYTDKELPRIAAEGVRHVQVLCPGFAVDCLETLEEIAIRGREQFLAAGGERLDYIPTLNDSDAHVRVLQSLIEHHICDWKDLDEDAGA
ncbi:MAG: ferrochelatase [Rudaea sp.]